MKQLVQHLAGGSILDNALICRTDISGYISATYRLLDQCGAGRYKELLITAGGENIAPIPIEDTLKDNLGAVTLQHWLLLHCYCLPFRATSSSQ